MMILNAFASAVLASTLMFGGITTQEQVEPKAQCILPMDFNNDTFKDIEEVSMKKTSEKKYTAVFSGSDVEGKQMTVKVPFSKNDVVDIRIKDSKGKITEFKEIDLSSYAFMLDFFTPDYKGTKISIEFE